MIFTPKAEADAAQERGVVVAEQVRGDDDHAVEAVEFLHEHVPVLIDRGRAAFADGDAAGEERIGFVEEEDRAEFASALEAGDDVLGGVAEVFRDHRGVIDLIERLSAEQGHAKGGAGFPGAGLAEEVEDAAAGLRLDGADVPDALKVGAAGDGAHAGHDLLTRVAVQDEPRQIVLRFRFDDDAEFRGGSGVAVAASRVPVVVVGDGIGRELDFAVVGLPCVAGRVVVVWLHWHGRNGPAVPRGVPSDLNAKIFTICTPARRLARKMGRREKPTLRLTGEFGRLQRTSHKSQQPRKLG